MTLEGRSSWTAAFDGLYLVKCQPVTSEIVYYTW